MTTTKTNSIQEVLTRANPNTLADVLRKLGPFQQLPPIKVTFASLTAAAGIDITTSASKTAATIVGLTLATGEFLPAIGQVVTCRVTAVGTGATGTRVMTDASGTAVAPSSGIAGVAKLSDDGKTITFEGTVTAFILTYYPRSSVAMSDKFDPSTVP